MILIGIGALALAAVGVLIWLAFGSSETRLPADRRRPGVQRDGGALTSVTTWTTDAMSRLVRGRESVMVEQFALASIKMKPAEFLVWSLVSSFTLGAIGALAGGIIGTVVGALLAFAGMQAWVTVKTALRRKRFNDQMLETLQTLSGGLRAGQGLMSALAMVAEESDSPTAEEFSRAVNEARIGADLVSSLQAVADRNRSESMSWMVKSIAINQEVGGGLADAIDGAAETIQARMQLVGTVKAMAAEGKMSAYILMALPFFVAIVVSIMTPGYLDPLFTYWVGWLILAGCAISFAIGGFLMAKVIKIKY